MNLHNDKTITDVIADSTDFNVDRINNKSSFNHIPMDAAITRVDNGTMLMSEMAKIFQARLDVEDREIGFSIRVSRPNLYELEIPSSTAEKSLGYLKNYYLFVSREQAAHRRSLDEDLIYELEQSRQRRLNQVTEHKNNIITATEEAATAASELTKAKQSYLKVLADVETVRHKLSTAVKNLHALKNMTEAEKKKKKEEDSKYSMGRLFSAFERSPEDECKHQSKKLKKLEVEMVTKQHDIADRKRVLLEKIERKEHFYSQAAVSFEKAESERLYQTEKALRQYCTIEKLALEARLRLLKSFEEGAIANLNSAADVELFATRSRDMDNTRMYSNALKMMEWDYRNRVENGDAPDEHSAPPSGTVASKESADGSSQRESVWTDVEGDTELKPMHITPDDQEDSEENDRRAREAAELNAVEEEVNRIIDHYYEEKPSLDYLVSKLQKEVGESSISTDTASIRTENKGKSTPVKEQEEGVKEKSQQAKVENESDASDSGKDNGEEITLATIDIDEKKDDGEGENRGRDEGMSEGGLSSQQARVLFCVTILSETIFGPEPSPGGGAEVSRVRDTTECDEDDRRRVQCLSMVGFSAETGRNAFLQLLDDKRGRYSTLDVTSFTYMTIAMKIFLDKCIDPRAVKDALRLANMSITFHKLVKDENAADCSEASRHYVQREGDINQHELWHTMGFWEDALSHGLREQITMMEPVQWDELEPDILKEKVAAIHNILFGQLGTLAFTMHEMGLEKSYVQNLVMNLGRASQLGDDLQLELFKSINISFGEAPVVTSPATSPRATTSDEVSPKSLEVRGGDFLEDSKVSTVHNEEIELPPEQERFNESKDSDVKELL